MPNTTSFESKHGTIYVDVEERSGGTTRGGEEKNIPAMKKFEDAMGSVQSVANSVIDTLKNLVETPDEVQIKLGVRFSGEVGAIIAKAKTDANLDITLTWKKK